MRFYISVLLVLATASALMAQKRVLITSDGDAILLKKGESALEAARIQGLIKEGQISSATCGTTTSFGFDDKHYPCNQPFVGYHHDVWGQWFISPSSGTIESLFVYTNDQNDMDGGVGRVRILKSNIYPGHGPGSGPYNVPRHSWGYYKNSNQTDEAFGITPFKGHATDPNWIATNQVYDSITSITGISDGAESFDPLGDELWPGLDDQGFPKTFTINSINSLAMADGPSVPEVAKGDPIFVTIEQIGSHHAPQGNNADAATWCMSNSGIPAIPVNWKFYEHKTGGTFGWHARAEASWMWWIVMNVTGDVPPDILYMDRLPHTLSTGARTVNANIQDCNPGHPDTAGVASVSLTYSVDGGSNSAHAMINDVGDHYYFTIPGQSAGSYVNYTITCTDIKGNVKTLGPITYEVVPMRNVYYVTDTSAAYSWAELSGNGGTKLDPNNFFNSRGTQGPATDDGTHPGFTIPGGPVTLFADTFGVAWIGVNGGLALTHTLLDTQQINGIGGSFSGSWLFPGKIIPNTDIPKNFVAPFSNDFVIGAPTTDYPYAHGAVWYKRDGTKFIVEWDSVGVVSKLIADTLHSFEVIFDGADKSITFQFKKIHGSLGLDTSSIIGLESDSLVKWVLINKENNPKELRPREGHAIKLALPGAVITSLDGWNLVSVPTAIGNFSKDFVYPAATSSAFAYIGGSYQGTDPLSNGPGYWVTLPGNQPVPYPGTGLTSLDITVATGWNMVGSIGVSVNTASVIETPPNILLDGTYFNYNGGYNPASTLDPGLGYWVQTTASGSLHLNAASSTSKGTSTAEQLSQLNVLRIRDDAGHEQTLYFGRSSNLSVSGGKFALPPPSPSGTFDVRFASQRMLELAPGDLKGDASFPIRVVAKYPITISWSMKGQNGDGYMLAYQSGKKDEKVRALRANGSMQLQQPAEGLRLRISSVGSQLPIEFALGQNYPNPFNPTTEIQYALPVDARVSLKVYNITGQEVATLLDDVQEAGYHERLWNSRNFSNVQLGSGVYFYRLIATGVSDSKALFDQVRKMILMK